MFSEGGQHGVISTVFSHMGIHNNFYVEFGFGYHTISTDMNWKWLGLNTAYLRQSGWHGSYFDAILRSEELNITQAVLTPMTTVQHFLAASVPVEVDYVSIDVDSLDLWLLHALVGGTSPYRPRLISIEYNANFAPDMLVSMEKDWHAWPKRSVYGASVGAIDYIRKLHGYTPIYIMPSKLDILLLRNDIHEKQCKQPPTFVHLANVARLPK